MRTTGFVWQERYAWHNTGLGGHLRPGLAVQAYPHFENPDAKARLASLVEVSGLLDHLTRIPARHVTEEDLLRVHTARYVEAIRDRSATGDGFADEDGWVPIGEGAFDIARFAAGGVLAAAEAVHAGRVDNAYALVRPPGHHAEADTGMGFCVFANIAVAIAALRATHGVRRVAVVDWDVHHGNGTQHLFETDPDVLTISIHQDGLFPMGTGGLDERGTGAGVGSVLNVPLPAGSGNGAYADTLTDVVVPALERFGPELIFVACGLDACAMDPMGRQTVTAEGFRAMTRIILAAAAGLCDGRVVMVHEGGYSAYYAPHCGLAVIEELSGHRTGLIDPYGPGFEDLPGQRTTPAQREVIDAAAALVASVPAGATA